VCRGLFIALSVLRPRINPSSNLLERFARAAAYSGFIVTEAADNPSSAPSVLRLPLARCLARPKMLGRHPHRAVARQLYRWVAAFGYRKRCCFATSILIGRSPSRLTPPERPLQCLAVLSAIFSNAC
jgi:hypothetical protein